MTCTRHTRVRRIPIYYSRSQHNNHSRSTDQYLWWIQSATPFFTRISTPSTICSRFRTRSQHPVLSAFFGTCESQLRGVNTTFTPAVRISICGGSRALPHFLLGSVLHLLSVVDPELGRSIPFYRHPLALESPNFGVLTHVDCGIPDAKREFSHADTSQIAWVAAPQPGHLSQKSSNQESSINNAESNAPRQRSLQCPEQQAHTCRHSSSSAARKNVSLGKTQVFASLA